MVVFLGVVAVVAGLALLLVLVLPEHQHPLLPEEIPEHPGAALEDLAAMLDNPDSEEEEGARVRAVQALTSPSLQLPPIATTGPMPQATRPIHNVTPTPFFTLGKTSSEPLMATSIPLHSSPVRKLHSQVIQSSPVSSSAPLTMWSTVPSRERSSSDMPTSRLFQLRECLCSEQAKTWHSAP